MGYTEGWNSKQELVAHLTDPASYGPGYKLLAKSLKGNHLWVVWQTGTGKRFIMLALLGYHQRGGWGYKDMEESMGPYETDVPLKFLDMVPPDDDHYGWREKVRAHYAHASAKSALVKRLAPGVRVKFIDKLTVQGVPITAGTIRSVSPLVVIPDEHPYPAKLKKTHIAEVLPGHGAVAGGKRRHAGVGTLTAEVKALLK